MTTEPAPSTDTCQAPPPEKPSDRIELVAMQSLHASIKAAFAIEGQQITDEELTAFREGDGGKEPALQIGGLSCYVAAIKGELDREAERRAAWEARIEERLQFMLRQEDIEAFRRDHPTAKSVFSYLRDGSRTIAANCPNP